MLEKFVTLNPCKVKHLKLDWYLDGTKTSEKKYLEILAKFTNLSSLQVQPISINHRNSEKICHTDNFPKLRKFGIDGLFVSSQIHNEVENQVVIRDFMARMFPLFPNLTALELAWIGKTGLEHVLVQGNFPKLKSLSLANCDLDWGPEAQKRFEPFGPLWKPSFSLNRLGFNVFVKYLDIYGLILLEKFASELEYLHIFRIPVRLWEGVPAEMLGVPGGGGDGGDVRIPVLPKLKVLKISYNLDGKLDDNERIVPYFRFEGKNKVAKTREVPYKEHFPLLEKILFCEDYLSKGFGEEEAYLKRYEMFVKLLCISFLSDSTAPCSSVIRVELPAPPEGFRVKIVQGGGEIWVDEKNLYDRIVRVFPNLECDVLDLWESVRLKKRVMYEPKYVSAPVSWTKLMKLLKPTGEK